MIGEKTFVITEDNVDQVVVGITNWMHSKVSSAGRKGIVLGMSGGLDCSVVAALCVGANIPVHLILMPYGLDMKKSSSEEHAMELIEKFDFSHHTFDIKPAVDALTISPDGELFEEASESNLALAKANIRPRVRMTYLYQFAQLKSYFVAGTSNLSERMLGYFTKWGDGGSDINPLGLMTKQEVRIVARALGVPESIIDKPPSAGLWEGQTDEDELGMTYDQIDSYILNATSGSDEIDAIIEGRIELSRHKFDGIPLFEG